MEMLMLIHAAAFTKQLWWKYIILKMIKSSQWLWKRSNSQWSETRDYKLTYSGWRTAVSLVVSKSSQ